ncbi:MAG: T9SS type A sorting domain-containing protein [Bacteroidetes bacterium]|nr:T9SS type A sorting domain-containing protein [Bacteroidota bacterium]
MHRLIFLIIPFIFLLSHTTYAQRSWGGSPLSFSQKGIKTDVPLMNISSINMKERHNEADYDKSALDPFEIGYTINTNFNLINAGIWENVRNGDRIWRLSVRSEGAKALSAYFTDFYLPNHCELFIYNEDRSVVLGSYTSENNSDNGIFATEMIEGEMITFELYQDRNSKEEAKFTINEIGHIYQYAGWSDISLKDFGDSDPCEVNVNCSEGEYWQNQKRSVVMIVVNRNSVLRCCSGALINNANQDFTPYLLTAEHCCEYANASDYSNLVFYFNYETSNCENPNQEPTPNTMTGSQLLAKASLSQGSEFKLLLLNNDVPPAFNPYFSGWDRRDQTSQSGVSIHHPNGDIKKISTYRQPLISSIYKGGIEDPNGKFWKVIWAETVNGHGVTEVGSSGSPIFNSEGRLIGSLSGGWAECSGLTLSDYYGKFSYSWESNGTSDDLQLKAWLDPQNTGLVTLNGIDYGELFIPEFRADTVIVPVGGSLNFSDLSVGTIDNWEWTFEGALPSSSSLESPFDVIYSNIGYYDVSLRISNSSRNEYIIKSNYIKVVPIVSPVPTNDNITIYLGTTPVDNVVFTIYDALGQKVDKYYSDGAIKSKVLDLSHYKIGFYFLRVQTAEYTQTHKIAIY